MDDDFDDYDDYEDPDDLDFDTDELDETTTSSISDTDIELDAFTDGQLDAEFAGFPYGGYGISVDEDKLTDEQKELYDTEYLAGYQYGEDTESDN